MKGEDLMEIYPAIDIRNGRAVRLLRGDYDKMTVYDDDPAAVARSFRESGAGHLHIVDLDGAKDGETSNFDLISRIIAESGMFTEVGGGIRDEDRIRRYLDAGVSRVILGTLAAERPDFAGRMAAKYGEAIAVGVDARDGKVAVRGWLETTELDSMEFCVRMRDLGVKTVIYTDISRDGAMSGTNIEAYERLSATEGLDIIASGGISSLEEIRQLNGLVRGAILGKSLYDGVLDLAECIRTAGETDGEAAGEKTGGNDR